MSNYGSIPPPGPYTPPGASTPSFNAQQQQSHQPGAPNQAQSGHAHKSGGFGQMMNQAVTTGKPMLNKLGKTISSKLGGKQAAGGPPQHLQSYSNYQHHQGQGQGQQQSQTQPQGYQQQQQPQQNQQQPQGYQQQQHGQSYSPQPQQQQGHTYSPQPQQQQWQPPQQPPQAPPPAQNAYAPQQSPFQQSNYATPASGHSGQSNYFPAQQPNGPPPNYNSTPLNAPGNMAPSDQQTYAQQGQQGQYGQQGHQGPPGPPQGQFQQNQQFQAGQYSDQQTGTIGTTPSPGYFQNTQTSHMGDVSPELTPSKPALQPSMPPPQQSYGPGAPQQPYQGAPTPSGPQDHAQWNATSPISPQGHGAIPPVSVSPSPHQTHVQPQPAAAPSAPTQAVRPLSPLTQHTAPEAGPTEFIAELPADMGNLNIGGSKPSGGQYQAYSPQGEQPASPTNRFSLPRRAVSSSSLPLADPWRFADPMTEQPTREFYILANLLFDALDRKFEPQNTGLLEAPKVLRSWMELTQDAYRLFSYRDYTAIAHMWSLEGIPHIMVPVQSTLTPVWNFNQHSHAQDLKVVTEPQSTYATYIPALNRAGWYKFFFLEMNAGSDDLGKLLSALCADTYKPGVLNHPDLGKRDRADIPALQTRAAEIQAAAIRRVCEEAQAGLLSEQGQPGMMNASQAPHNPSVPNAGQHGSGEDMAMLMHEIQMASNDMAVNSVRDGEVTYRPGGNQPGGYGRLV